MSSKMQTLILFLVLTISSFTIKVSAIDAPLIAIYWGQNRGDGTLSSTCDNENYKIVLLAFLNVFGEGRTPDLDFSDFCGHGISCTKLEPEIKHCQTRGVNVFLSIGGRSGDYSIGSRRDAETVSKYLHTNFLSGELGPLGSVTLDGIDFKIEKGSNLFWDDLARNLDKLRRQSSFYLSATPKCQVPDHHLHKAIKTGLFDYVFVQFYNNHECQFDSVKSNSIKLLKSWNTWTSLVLPNNTVLMGLPAAQNAATSGGYIPPSYLISNVLPYIKTATNYGGVVLRDRYADKENDYSDQIFSFVTQVSEATAESVSAA